MKLRIRKILFNWLAHFGMVWVVINLFTVVPYIYYVNRNGNYLFHDDKTPVSAWEYFFQGNFRYDIIVVALFLLLAEINYTYFFAKLKWHQFAAGGLLISILSFLVLALHRPEALKVSGIWSAAQPILLMAAYAIVYGIIRDYFYQLKHKKELQLQQTENELNALKSQLNPHFLFNSLNYLYGTALKESAPVTADGIDQLSDLLRYTITGMHTNFVPLEEEIQFINNYLALQKARLPGKEDIIIDVQINVVEPGWKIAPLLLLTFIENAFKYGISMNEHSNVNIMLNISKGCLTLQVVNKIIKGHSQVKGSNTGIKSTLKRLELLYRGRYKLANSNTGTDYEVSLQLQLNK
jgi:sensor histidine kinase YesM